MKTCLACQTANADDNRFCQQCGRPLTPGEGQTVRWTAEQVAAARLPVFGPRGSVPVESLFAGRDRLLIGRDHENELCLNHPSVSRVHAVLSRGPEGLLIADLGSVNGVTHNGRRVREPVRLADGDQVGIGPYLFRLQGDVVFTVDASRSLRLEARGLEKAIRLGDGGTRKLLENVNLVVEPGEFVSLLGPSGSGKSTLMDCLNGRRRATGGKVLANGEDFYRYFDSFRQSLGYVPQKDIIHTQLTVARALYFTALLRLPADTTEGERQGRIEEVLRQMELGPHRDTLVANLSGGQIKRVSLGAELIGRPCLLYIDEATSGLDAGTEARMMRLFRRLSEEGKSVVCITHNIDNVDCCHLVLYLVRGRLAYFGPPAEAPAYFGVRRLGEIYDRLAEKPPEEWENAFADHPLHAEYVGKRLAQQAEAPPAPIATSSMKLAALPLVGPALVKLAESAAPAPVPAPPRTPWFHQFRVLTRRYLELIRGDRRSLRLLLLQAPIVAAFVLLGFVGKPYQNQVLAPRKLTDFEQALVEAGIAYLPHSMAFVRDRLTFIHDHPDTPVLPDRVIVDPRYNYMLLFLLTVITLWFGCNNAAKEIVKEEPVYSRERAINLRLGPYLASKFLVQSVLSALQAGVLLVCVMGTLELLATWFGFEAPYPGYRLPYPELFGMMVLVAMTGVALGLLLSACVSSPDRANTLLPYVLIPQIILGGGIMPVKAGVMYWVATLLSPVYWGYRAARTGETEFPKDLPVHMDYDDRLGIPCAALAAQAAVLLAAAAWFLWRKDKTGR